MKREGSPRNIDERSFEFACDVVVLCEKIRRRRGAATLIASQLLRSGTSVGANLAEARSGQSKADFLAKCRVSLKEARETHYWLRIIHRTGILQTSEVDTLIEESNELIAILTAIVKNASRPAA
ncbi:MAG TPA: four helix bundle protein [Thermoanaerobaculia bacterium]|nr:four helix bundle protein [Thermoanaerobaculia bacterium]